MKFLPWIFGAALLLAFVLMGDLLVFVIRLGELFPTVAVIILILALIGLGIIGHGIAQDMTENR